MGYAEVSVNAPAAHLRTFSYAIPPHLDIQVGQAVWVPFGTKLLQGIVVELTPSPAVEQVKDIASIIDPQPLLSPEQIALARWISGYYLAPLFSALALMLPPGFERRVLTFFTLGSREFDEDDLNETQQKIMKLAERDGRIGLKELEKSLGKKKAQANSLQLVKLGILRRQYELERVKVKAKEVYHVRLLVPREEIVETIKAMTGGKAKKQLAVIKYLAEQLTPVTLADIKEKTGTERLTVNALVKKGLVSLEAIPVRREPLELQGVQLSQPLPLTPAQETVFRSVRENLWGVVSPVKPGKVLLLYGVTGSGKTEIYLQALAEAVKLGKRGIVMVPEIALTPQTIERFVSRFPGRVAVLHSHLSLGEQFDEWWRIKNGEVDVVIGPRSALFAPLSDPGIIIIDEEHEWTYKQHEQSPRYHVRDVAVKMSEMSGYTVLLGSATPSMESYYRARKEEYRLLQLPERVVRHTDLPRVDVIDMRKELRENNRSIFSRALTPAIDKALENHEQVILFLNRRGASTYIQCRNCGFVLKCRRCEVPMTYHLDTQSLLCHQCNYQADVPVLCPKCSSRRIRYLGIGTEKLEQEVKLSFPMARVLRWDRDVTRGRYSHQKILDKFRSHEADVLIGTQMVAKGLDLPLVTLVGVINADLSLGLPDFRAGERTFQLLSQVAGRAGRGAVPGQVIIQTYNPEHYAIQAAAAHNYNLFYEQEINFRRQFHEPPFVQLANLLFAHTNDHRCIEETTKMAGRIKEERDALGLAGIDVLGPAPAYIHRLRGRYRWQVIVRGLGLSTFLQRLTFPQGWSVDIDPIGL
ncbi:MAG: primosomal protein N' [Dehalococcoidia bacterium]|nr:primosomal protein N' [Dehalococcoidia bacterium]